MLIAAVQAYGIAVGLEGANSGGSSAVFDPGLFFRFTTVVTLVGGTLFLMWLGEQITARGVGNGTSLIIFSGIVANLPNAIAQMLELSRTGALSPAFIVLLLIGGVVVVAGIVFMERAQRRILVTYPKRQQGSRVYGGESTHLPLKLNTSGVIPPIFASSILLLPVTLAGFASGGSDILTTITALLGRGQPLYLLLYVSLIVFFAFFYTAVVFNPADTADNLKKYGGFIQGIRPGKSTSEYLDYVLTRLTVLGATYLAVICVLPEISDQQVLAPVLFRRHQSAHRRDRHYGHCDANPVSFVGAPIRRPDQEGPATGTAMIRYEKCS